ncbi:unnamed protein product [[Candida] boidinii]|uniref:Unnamed protein product n=1 Tax=Candida boidinii TaxID=5477 RepID=A0A9W6WES9_CANBO|nr:unnamed protein product [[Candida] boidinii]
MNNPSINCISNMNNINVFDIIGTPTQFAGTPDDVVASGGRSSGDLGSTNVSVSSGTPMSVNISDHLSMSNDNNNNNNSSHINSGVNHQIASSVSDSTISMANSPFANNLIYEADNSNNNNSNNINNNSNDGINLPEESRIQQAQFRSFLSATQQSQTTQAVMNSKFMPPTTPRYPYNGSKNRFDVKKKITKRIERAYSKPLWREEEQEEHEEEQEENEQGEEKYIVTGVNSTSTDSNTNKKQKLGDSNGNDKNDEVILIDSNEVTNKQEKNSGLKMLSNYLNGNKKNGNGYQNSNSNSNRKIRQPTTFKSDYVPNLSQSHSQNQNSTNNNNSNHNLKSSMVTTQEGVASLFLDRPVGSGFPLFLMDPEDFGKPANSNDADEKLSSSSNANNTNNSRSGDSSNSSTSQPTTSSSSQSMEDEIKQLKLLSKLPLAERLRPKTLDEYIGQDHLIGKNNGILRNFIENDRIPSLILWGPPGVGKTTLARIISHRTNCRFIELSATSNGISDCKKIFEESKNELKLTKRRTIVFVDEIHRFNKTQQDIFLPQVEKGSIILIGATTENPSFQLNNALLSRCRVFVLKKLEIPELVKVITRALLMVNKIRRLIYKLPILRFNRESAEYLSDICDGDSRSVLNLIELTDSYYNENFVNDNLTDDNNNANNGDVKKLVEIKPEDLKKIFKRTHMIYDRVGDSHYDTISAFHKSIRGSNEDGALYYLARMLKGGENPLYIARRLIRIASEDIGVLDDTCLPFAISAYQAVQFVGMPEADLALVHCTVKFCRAMKSVEIYRGWKTLNNKLDNEPNLINLPIPLHLRNAPTKLMSELGYSKGYKYNPDYKDGKAKQDYLPDSCKDLKILDGKHLGELIDSDLD